MNVLNIVAKGVQFLINTVDVFEKEIPQGAKEIVDTLTAALQKFVTELEAHLNTADNPPSSDTSPPQGPTRAA